MKKTITFLSSKIQYLLFIFTTLIYFFLSCYKHQQFESSGFDLGILDQAIWLMSRSEAPVSTIMGAMHIFGDHFNPIILSFIPFYWLVPKIEILFLIQAILVALSIFPIFYLAKGYFGQLIAVLVLFFYITYWPLQEGINFDVHDLAFSLPFVAYALYFLAKDKIINYLICLALLLLVKENMALLVVFFGLYNTIFSKYRLLGLIIIFFGLLWFFLTILVLMPYFSGGIAYQHWLYQDLGDDLITSLLAVFHNPFLPLKLIVNSQIKIDLLNLIYKPSYYLSFFSPINILNVPLITGQLLSNSETFLSTKNHHWLPIAPLATISMLDTVNRLNLVFKKPLFKKIFTCLVFSIILFTQLNKFSETPLYRLTRREFYQPYAYLKIVREIKLLIPPDASILTQNSIIPHFSQRKSIYIIGLYEEEKFEADYILISDKVDAWPYNSFPEMLQDNLTLIESYQPILSSQGWSVFRKIN